MKEIILLDQNIRDREFLSVDWEACFNSHVSICPTEISCVQKMIEGHKGKVFVIKNSDLDFWHINNFLENQEKITLVVQSDLKGCLKTELFERHQIIDVVDFFDKENMKNIFSSIGAMNFGVSKKRYHRVRLYKFFQFNFAAVDTYIKINDGKFVKLIQKGELFTNKVLKKYHEKEVEFLYVKEEDYAIFLEKLSEILFNLYGKKSLSEGVRKEVDSASIDIISNKLEIIGLSSETIELALKTVESVVQSFRKSERLWEYLKSENRRMFLTDHSLSISMLVCAIAEKIEWNVSYILNKLVMATLLHDIGIKSTHLTYIKGTEDRGFKGLSSEEKDEYLKHPLKGCQLLQSFPDLPLDVDRIVLEHHERPDGSGFPKKLDSFSISPLSCVLILAEEFYLFLHEGGHSLEARNKAIKELAVTHSQGNFKQSFKSLKELFSGEGSL